jgi:hypothetical protein
LGKLGFALGFVLFVIAAVNKTREAAAEDARLRQRAFELLAETRVRVKSPVELVYHDEDQHLGGFQACFAAPEVSPAREMEKITDDIAIEIFSRPCGVKPPPGQAVLSERWTRSPYRYEMWITRKDGRDYLYVSRIED